MTEAAEMLKPTEAAVVSGVELRDVNHAIDRGILPEGHVTRGRERRVSAIACIFLTFYHGSADRLTSVARLFAIDEMSRRLRDKPDHLWMSYLGGEWIVQDDFLQIDLQPFATSTLQRWELYKDAQKVVTSSPDILSGTPVIKGTRVPAHDVAASVATGHSTERILAAYPSLTAKQVALAALYAKANPLQGRPRARPMLEGAQLVSEERVPRRQNAG